MPNQTSIACFVIFWLCLLFEEIAKKRQGLSRLPSGEILIAVTYLFPDIFIYVAISWLHHYRYLLIMIMRTYISKIWWNLDVRQIKENYSWLSASLRLLLMQHLPLCDSVMVSNMSFSSAVSGELLQASEGHLWINEHADGIKAEIFQLLKGQTLPRIKRQYAPQLVHHSEIIVLLRSAAVQVAKQIYDIITQTKYKWALYLGHTYMLSKGPLGGMQNKK